MSIASQELGLRAGWLRDRCQRLGTHVKYLNSEMEIEHVGCEKQLSNE
jgi:hypothetical protein